MGRGSKGGGSFEADIERLRALARHYRLMADSSKHHTEPPECKLRFASVRIDEAIELVEDYIAGVDARAARKLGT